MSPGGGVIAAPSRIAINEIFRLLKAFAIVVAVLGIAWTGPFVEQITMFPAGHDDMVDAMTQASSWLLQASQHTVEIYNAFTGKPISDSYW